MISMPSSWAMAGICNNALVLPEIAACTKIAFSKLAIVIRSLGLIPGILANFTDCIPA